MSNAKSLMPPTLGSWWSERAAYVSASKYGAVQHHIPEKRENITRTCWIYNSIVPDNHSVNFCQLEKKK